MRLALTVVLATVIAFAIVIASGSARYDGELHVNLPSLFIVTVLFALPGLPLMLGSFVMLCVKQESPTWRWTFLCGALGSIVAALAVAALAYVGDCIPHCKSARGGLTDGVLLAIPAGFTAGIAVPILWLLIDRISSRRAR